MVNELHRQLSSRLDFVVDTRDLHVRVDGDRGLVLAGAPSAADYIPRAGFPLLTQATRQLGEKAEPSIPARFLDAAVAKSPQRIADYLTGVMHDHHERRLVRVLDGTVRAVLSDSYRAIDNIDVASMALDVARSKGAAILEATISDSHLRVKMVAPEIVEQIDRAILEKDEHRWINLRPGSLGNADFIERITANNRTPGRLPNLPSGPNTVCPTVTVSNSETGHGGLNGQLGILQALCVNVSTVETKVAQVHLGSKLETGIFTRETVLAEADVILRKLRDLVVAGFEPAHFKKLVDRLRATVGAVLPQPIAAAKVAIGLGSLGIERLEALNAHFFSEPGAHDVHNLGQAVARLAQDMTDADDAANAEAVAGQIMLGKFNHELLTAMA